MADLVAACRDAGVSDERVLAAVGAVDRRNFVPLRSRALAGRDVPVPIGGGQTTSQPSLIARMVEVLELGGDDHVLEVGTGSGYQTAILAALVARVTSIERNADLADRARTRLAHLTTVEIVTGDGSRGWAEGAPYDAITVGASGPRIPSAFVEQLVEGGRLVLPVDRPGQEVLEVHRRRAGRLEGPERVLPVRFVPLIGEDAYPDAPEGRRG